MYGLGAKDDDTVNSGNASKPDADIETEIKKEVEGLRVSSKKALIQPVKLDTQCGKVNPCP